MQFALVLEYTLLHSRAKFDKVFYGIVSKYSMIWIVK